MKKRERSAKNKKYSGTLPRTLFQKTLSSFPVKFTFKKIENTVCRGGCGNLETSPATSRLHGVPRFHLQISGGLAPYIRSFLEKKKNKQTLTRFSFF
jgi:hypothetical protein